jgi:phosphoribosylanthranilate isomerase
MMNERVWVKICGLTTVEGVQAAVDAGADAIGFVFAPSKRQVIPARALELAKHAPREITRVAVMLHPTQAQVDEVCEVFRPDVVQSDAEDFEGLRLPAGVQALPVVRSASASDSVRPELVEGLRKNASTGSARTEEKGNRVLFEGPISGAGETSDWSLAARLASITELVLAGGLNAANVREAIARVRPFGVDVSSGVESAPGVKDSRKIYEFVRAARAGVLE